MSIKAGERSSRGISGALEVIIGGPSTPVPKQWAKYINNPKNKENLCNLYQSLCVVLTRGGSRRIPNRSSQEDSRMEGDV